MPAAVRRSLPVPLSEQPDSRLRVGPYLVLAARSAHEGQVCYLMLLAVSQDHESWVLRSTLHFGTTMLLSGWSDRDEGHPGRPLALSGNPGVETIVPDRAPCACSNLKQLETLSHVDVDHTIKVLAHWSHWHSAFRVSMRLQQTDH
jgi:hypothetical protein